MSVCIWLLGMQAPLPVFSLSHWSTFVTSGSLCQLHTHEHTHAPSLNWELWTQHHGKPSREEQARGKPRGRPLPPTLSTSLCFSLFLQQKRDLTVPFHDRWAWTASKREFLRTSVIQSTNRERESERQTCCEGRQAAGLEILWGVRWQKKRDLVPPGISSIPVHPLFLRLLSLCCYMCWSTSFLICSVCFVFKSKNKAVWKVDGISIICYLCSVTRNSMLLNMVEEKSDRHAQNTVYRRLKKSSLTRIVCHSEFNR